MSRPPVEAVLFDLDGTLVHSELVAAKAVDFVFAKYGRVLDPIHSAAVTGRTWASAMDELQKRVGLPADREQLLQEILEEYRIRLKTEVHPVPGSEQAVARLAARYRLALVSGSYREEILFALKKLQIVQHFDPILGAEDYVQSKPAPDGYLKALNILGLQPSQAVVFEDSEPGIRSALAAGCRVIAVRHCGSLDPSSPWLARADVVVDTLETVHPGWLESVLR